MSDDRPHLTIFVVRPSRQFDEIYTYFEEQGFDLDQPDATWSFTIEIVEINNDASAREYIRALGLTISALFLIEPLRGADDQFGVSHFRHWIGVFLKSVG